MVSPFVGLFTGNSQAAPAAPSNAKPFSGLFSAQSVPITPSPSPVAPVQPVSPSAAPIGSPAPVSTPSGIPANALKGSLGGGYGASNITDPASGKPLLTYENQQAKASQLLSDRTAPTFDPTKPQKIDPKTLQDPRMKESVSQGIKSAVGGSAYEELDHIMPLELGGSNNKTNLRLEPAQNSTQKYSGSNPTNTDALENSLAAAAHNGDTTGVSLVDAWKAMAKAKGVTLPEDGGAVPNLGEKSIQPNTQPDEQPKPSLMTDLATGKTSSGEPNLLSKIGSGVEAIVKNPGEASKGLFNALGGNAIVHPIQTLNSIVDKVKNDADGATNNLLSSAAQFKSDVLTPSTNRDLSTKAASTMNLLTAIAGFSMLPVSETFNIASQLPVIKPAADAVGIVFDKSGKVTSFGADKLLGGLVNVGAMKQSTADTLKSSVDSVATLAGQIVLGGYIYGKATGLMDAKGDMTAQDTKTIVEDAQTKAEEINNNPVSEKATPEVKTPGETPAQVQPTPTEASTIASAEAPKEPTVTPTETKTAEPTVEPATVKVSRAQLPVGEGAIKTSGLEARMKASLDNLSEGDKANISNYKEMNNANQLKAAADYVRANPDEAMEVLKGNKPAPKGLLMNAIYLALQESGKGDRKSVV